MQSLTDLLSYGIQDLLDHLCRWSTSA